MFYSIPVPDVYVAWSCRAWTWFPRMIGFWRTTVDTPSWETQELSGFPTLEVCQWQKAAEEGTRTYRHPHLCFLVRAHTHAFSCEEDTVTHTYRYTPSSWKRAFLRPFILGMFSTNMSENAHGSVGEHTLGTGDSKWTVLQAGTVLSTWSHTGGVEPKQVQGGTVVSSGRAWLATKVKTTALAIKEGNRS